MLKQLGTFSAGGIRKVRRSFGNNNKQNTKLGKRNQMENGGYSYGTEKR